MKNDTCNGKTKFSKKEAQTALNSLRRRGIKRRPERIYPCTVCNHWHLTSSIHENRNHEQYKEKIVGTERRTL